MSSEDEVRIFDQIKARIEEHNQRDYQAIARGKEERDKWLQAKSESSEADDPET